MKRHILMFGPLALAGCTVGPNYSVPKLPTPAAFAEDQGPQATPDLQGWWHAYHDPELERLIAMGLADNPDLKSAAARIRGARAQERVARSAYFPQVNATAGSTYEQFSKNAGLSSLASLLGGGGSSGHPRPVCRTVRPAASPRPAMTSPSIPPVSTPPGSWISLAALAAAYRALALALRRLCGVRAMPSSR
jgi:hypothetical protein